MIPRRDGFALLFAMGFPSLATWLYFDVLAGHPAMRPVVLAGKLLQFAFPVVWAWGVCREPVRLGRPRREGIGLGLILGLAILGAMLAVHAGWLQHSAAFAGAPARVRAKLADLGAETPLAFLGLAALIAGLHSLLEEYYWRWFVFGRLRRGMPWGRAAALSSLAFMAHHVIVLNAYVARDHFWSVTAPLSLGVAAGGFAWAWLYHRTGSLYGPWLSHLLADAGLMWIGYDAVWGTAG